MNIEFLEKLESALCEKCDVNHSDCIGENECFCTLDMARAYQQGRADVIQECIDILNDSIPLVDNTDIIFGFKCACERLEQLKEEKNE